MKHKQIEINVEATQGAIEAIEALTQRLLKQIEDAENKGCKQGNRKNSQDREL